MPDFHIERYAQQHKQLWNDFISTAKNATFLFHRDFMEYHSDRFEDFSLLIFKSDKLFAVLPANLKDNRVYSHQGLTYGGLVLHEKARLQDVVLGFRELLEFLAAKKISYLEIKLLPSFYAKFPSEELDYVLFLTQAQLVKIESASVIDYNARLALHRSRFGGLKKAERHQLEIQETNDFESFWREILIPNLEQRHDAQPTHSIGEIALLAQRFPKNIRQFNVLDGDGNLVAGATVFQTETTAHVQYISANSKRQELGSLDFLFDELINDVFSTKRYFDFGISTEESGRKLNTGLQAWKESFGARQIAQRTFRVDTSQAKNLNDVLL